MSSYHPSPGQVLLVVGDMETDPGHQEIRLLPVNDAKRDQRRRMPDDVDELKGSVNIFLSEKYE